MTAIPISEAKEMFLAQLPLIESVIEATCRRSRVAGSAAEDLRSEVIVKLLDRDYRVLRSFRGQSSLATYLTVVTRRLLLDQRIREWGRWRSSTRARSLGPVAMRLEELISRDRRPVAEAVEILASDASVEMSRRELREMADRLPMRNARPTAASYPVEQLVSSGRADDPLLSQERTRAVRGLTSALSQALDGLEAEDQRLLRLRFGENRTVASIARTLGLNQRKLYSRVERILSQLRGSLEERGVDSAKTAELIGSGGIDAGLLSGARPEATAAAAVAL